MEAFVLDNIVNNIIHKKKKVSKQISLMREFFLGSMDKEINEEVIADRIKEIKLYKDQLHKISLIPKIEQRSEEWYNIRKSLITASDFAQALGKGKFGTVTQFYKNKCGYEDKKLDMSIPALQWGVRYEEVANMFYKKKMNVEVHEFGILQHPDISYIGASPDGISNMGIMLEIKCPWRRKCTETIPEQYYYQIQGQLEVCNLEECDYLECYIVEYEDKEEMVNDGKIKYKGVVVEMDNGGYRYGEIDDTEYSVMGEYRRIYYYGIREYFMKRVKRDRNFFGDILHQITEVWKNVEKYREDEDLYRSVVKTRTRVKKEPKCIIKHIEEDCIKENAPKYMFRKFDDDSI